MKYLINIYSLSIYIKRSNMVIIKNVAHGIGEIKCNLHLMDSYDYWLGKPRLELKFSSTGKLNPE